MHCRTAHCGLLAASARGGAISVLPAEFALAGAEARQQLVVERSRDGQFVGQVRRGRQFASRATPRS